MNKTQTLARGSNLATRLYGPEGSSDHAVTDQPDAPERSTDRAPRPAARWMPWAGKGRPATGTEETSLVMQLSEFAGQHRGPAQRSDITAVVNALRCGLTLADVLDRAPGLRPARLYAAYVHLETARARAADAWQRIVGDRTLDALDEFGDEAAKILPGPVARLRAAVAEQPDRYDVVLEQVAESVESTSVIASLIERDLEACAHDHDQAAQVGRLLYGQSGEGISSSPDYLASRLGLLIPARVASLLGERTDVSSLTPRAPRC